MWTRVQVSGAGTVDRYRFRYRHSDGARRGLLPRNAAAELGRDTIYWHYPLEKPHFLGGRSSGAIRKGKWKLVLDGYYLEGVSAEEPVHLADLDADL